MRPAEPDHRDRREHVEHELLRGTGLQPRRAGDHLGADEHADLAIGERGELGRLDARHAPRQRAARPRSLERADDPGRAPARADPHDRVGLGDAERLDCASAAGAVVLGFFARGDDRGDRDGEGGLALDGVERGEVAGGSRAGVDQAAAGGHLCRDVVDQRRDRGRRNGDGRRDGCVRRAHQLDELERGAKLEVCGSGIARFRAQIVERRHRAPV